MTTSSTLAHIGLDIGSTTVKLVILDRSSRVLYARYQRHLSDVRATVAQLFHEALSDASISGLDFTLAATGSGAIALTEEFGISFVQEVIASAESIRRRIPDVDVTIELGGEDAKITFFTGGVEQRMNETCAGGTGAFIDQMAAFLNTDASGLNELASRSRNILAGTTFVQQGQDIRLGKNTTAGGNRVDVATARGQLVEAGRIGIKEGCHLIDERTCTTGAGLVHTLFNATRKEGDFSILTAEFYCDIHIRNAPAYAFGRSYDFLNEGDSELLGQGDSTGTRGRKGKVEPRNALIVERFVEKLGNRRPYIGEVTLIACVEHTTRPVEDNELHCG